MEVNSNFDFSKVRACDLRIADFIAHTHMTVIQKILSFPRKKNIAEHLYWGNIPSLLIKQEKLVQIFLV